MKVTFDSNVWRIVCSPDKFPKESSISEFKQIREAIKSGKISPYICETVFTLEAIQRKNRKEFFSSVKSKTQTKTVEDENRAVMSFSMGPDKSAHPGNNDFLESHLQDALSIGFRIVGLPRIAGVVNADIEEHFYKHEDLEAYLERAFEAGVAIEKRGAGIAQIKEIGEEYRSPWFDGLKDAPESQNGVIAKAVAEWADGDSVACHIGVEGDYFCTRDSAKQGGQASILAQHNLEWLSSDFWFFQFSVLRNWLGSSQIDWPSRIGRL